MLKSMIFRGGFLAGPQRVSVFCVPPLAPPKSFPTNVFLCFCFLSEVIFGRVPNVFLCLVTPPLAAPKSFPTNVFLDFASGSVGLVAGIGSRGVVFLVFACKKQPPPSKLAVRLREYFRSILPYERSRSYDRLLERMSTRLRGDTRMLTGEFRLQSVPFLVHPRLEPEFLSFCRWVGHGGRVATHPRPTPHSYNPCVVL